MKVEMRLGVSDYARNVNEARERITWKESEGDGCITMDTIDTMTFNNITSNE